MDNKTMKCVMCSADMEVKREVRRYDIGLDEAIVLDDVEVSHCNECGEEFLGIPRVLDLHRYVAHHIAQKKAKLTPKDIRFLRTYLGYSGVDFGEKIGVTHETVSRWESTKSPTPIGPTSERLLRLMVLTQEPQRTYPLEEWGSEEAAPSQFRLKAFGEEWGEAVAFAQG